MVMTEEEIASAAARRSAARRKRVTKRCESCGTEFKGLTTKRFCSDRCRVEAARLKARGWPDDRHSRPQPEGPPFDVLLTDEDLEQRPDEDDADFFERLSRTVFGDDVLATDSVEIVRREREARSQHLAKLSGL